MSARRWIGMAGLVVAVTAGTVATARELAEPRFEAQVSLVLERREPAGVAGQGLSRPDRLFDTPEVRDLVRRRLGEPPAVRVTAATANTVLVRTRAARPWQATEATETYAASYVAVRRGQIESEAAAAAAQVRRKIVQVESQVATAEEPQRASLIEVLHFFNQRMDMLQLDMYGPYVEGPASPRPVGDGARGAWMVAAFGATLSVGAAASARGPKSEEALQK